MLQRPIAVDWAVPKKEFEEKSGKPDTGDIKEEVDVVDDDEEEDGEDVDESDDGEPEEDQEVGHSDLHF